MKKIALIGCSGMAKLYRVLYTQMQGAQLELVVGLAKDDPAGIARELGCPRWSTDWHDALADDIDIWDISTPNHLHAEAFCAAVAAGKHILLQKPIAASDADACAILAASRATDKNVGMFLSRHADTANHELKRILKAGVIGEVTSVHARTALIRRPAPNADHNWRSSAELTGGGCLMQLGIHDIDIIQWLLDDRICEVRAFCDNIRSPHIGGDDSSQVLFKTKGGVTGCVETSYCSKDTYLLIYGTQGSALYRGDSVYLTAENPHHSDYIHYTAVGQEVRFPLPYTGTKQYSVDNPHEQHVAFVRSVMENAPVPMPIEEGFRSFVIVKAAYHAARTGSSVNIEAFEKPANKKSSPKQDLNEENLRK